jgi:hypothetical protein
MKIFSGLLKFNLIQRVPPQIAARRLALTRTLVQVVPTHGAQTLAVGAAQRPLREFENNIFADVGGQVHEILPAKLLVKHKLVDPQHFLECFHAPATPQRGRHAQLAGHQ